MDIKQLEYFAAVVEEGNISSAAKKLHISQPPLSTQIQKLEEDVGCVLFERGSTNYGSRQYVVQKGKNIN